MNEALNASQERFIEAQEVLNDFMDENSALIDTFRDLVSQRNEALKDYADRARNEAKAAEQKRGVVEVGDFSFMKKIKQSYDPTKLLDSCPEAAKHRGVFKVVITNEFDDADTVKSFVGDPAAEIKVDKKKVVSLVEQGLLGKDKVAKALIEEPMTPSHHKGPKAWDVP